MVDGRFKTLTTRDGLGSDLVGALARAADGDLWAATLNGLSRLHDGRLQELHHSRRGSPSNIITALDAFEGGRMWIGTQDQGLNLWDGDRMLRWPGSTAKERSTPFTSDARAADASSRLLPDVLHGVLHDDRGHLWLASNYGLTRADIAPLLACAGKRELARC